jgi:hypothetical protein
MIELAASNTIPQYELELKFESEKKSFQKQINEFQNNFEMAQKKMEVLEFENSEYVLKSNTEIGRLNDVLDEKDILLRKAAKEVSMLRTG